jgi:hypothetical protein
MKFPEFRVMGHGDTDVEAAGFDGEQTLDINTA